jgi:hypothetical protein
MKKNYINPFRYLLVIIFVLSTITLKAGNDPFAQVGQVLQAGAADANLILNKYMEPLGKAWVYDMGNGWYNTAAPHKLLGFDITFGAALASPTSADKEFDLATLGLTAITPADPAKTKAPTILNGDIKNSLNIVLKGTFNGPTGPQPYTQNLTEKNPLVLQGFSLPAGMGMPLPYAQVGIGLVFGTDVTIRFFPQMKLGSYGKLGLWGFAIKHDIKQWIPVVKELPFDASVLIGYTKFTSSVDIDYKKSITGSVDYVNAAVVIPTNQKIENELSALSMNLLVSKKLLFFTPYLGIGYLSGSFKLNLNGDYILPTLAANPGFNPLQPISTTNPITRTEINTTSTIIKNPVKIDNPASGMNLTVGFRIKLLILTLHAQYTLQEYSTITAGLGFSFR